MQKIDIEVNGKKISKEVPDHTILSIFLRDHLNLTGTHIGCDTSQCGACVVMVNEDSVKSCTMLAVQAEGAEVTTVEGLASNGELHPMQQRYILLKKTLESVKRN